MPNGTVRVFDHDGYGRLNLIRDHLDATGEVLSEFALGHDIMDRVISERRIPPPTRSATAPPAAMTYDADDRLATWNGQPCASDPDGNLTAGPLGGAMGAFGFDARNRLVASLSPLGRREAYGALCRQP